MGIHNTYSNSLNDYNTNPNNYANKYYNTNSDSEVLLNVLAHELETGANGARLDPEKIFAAVTNVHRRVRGAYAVVAMIAGGSWYATSNASAPARRTRKAKAVSAKRLALQAPVLRFGETT